jgi:predicted MFS family arabinose efflux permease
MLMVLTLGWAAIQGGRFIIPPLLPRITDTFGFSPGGIGLALTVFGLFYALVQFPSGTYSDVLSRATLWLGPLLLQ